MYFTNEDVIVNHELVNFPNAHISMGSFWCKLLCYGSQVAQFCMKNFFCIKSVALSFFFAKNIGVYFEHSLTARFFPLCILISVSSFHAIPNKCIVNSK